MPIPLRGTPPIWVADHVIKPVMEAEEFGQSGTGLAMPEGNTGSGTDRNRTGPFCYPDLAQVKQITVTDYISGCLFIITPYSCFDTFLCPKAISC